jgi:hypothetical protein
MSATERPAGEKGHPLCTCHPVAGRATCDVHHGETEQHAVKVFTAVTCSCGWRYSSDSEGSCWAAAAEHQESFVDQNGGIARG